jgi:hypothetical protein
VERLGKQLDGLSAGDEAGTSLQITQATHAQPRQICQVCLGQTSLQPMPPKQVTKGLR